MRISVSSFWTQKLGNSEGEYEDAFWHDMTPAGCRVAVADGATEASFSREWAQILTKGFVTQPPRCWNKDSHKRNFYFSEWLKPLQRQWHATVNFNNLPWFAIEKAQKGAFASFLGLSINLEKKYWQACAIGDSDLFLFRKNKSFLLWPLDKVEQFGSTPFLLGSNSLYNRSIPKMLKFIQGQLQAGDEFFLATDALAEYMLLVGWNNVLLSSYEGFQSVIAEARENKLMKNDDTTLVVVKIEEV